MWAAFQSDPETRCQRHILAILADFLKHYWTMKNMKYSNSPGIMEVMWQQRHEK